jgi:hypothetical protein
MQNENDSLPSEYEDALIVLQTLGLLDVVQTADGEGYRLSEAILTNAFVPNAALFARLDLSWKLETLIKKT